MDQVCGSYSLNKDNGLANGQQRIDISKEFKFSAGIAPRVHPKLLDDFQDLVQHIDHVSEKD